MCRLLIGGRGRGGRSLGRGRSPGQRRTSRRGAAVWRGGRELRPRADRRRRPGIGSVRPVASGRAGTLARRRVASWRDSSPRRTRHPPYGRLRNPRGRRGNSRHHLSRQRGGERAARRDVVPASVPLQHPTRTLGQLPPHLTTRAPDPHDAHVVVGRGLVPHPGDHGRLCALLHRDPLGPRHRAAPDGRGVRGHPRRQVPRHRLVPGVEPQEVKHRGLELLDVRGLLLGAALASGLQAPLVRGVRPLGVRRLSRPRNVLGRSPDPAGEVFPPPDLLHRPRRSQRLHRPGDTRVARGKQLPAGGDGVHGPVGVADGARARAGAESGAGLGHGAG